MNPPLPYRLAWPLIEDLLNAPAREEPLTWTCHVCGVRRPDALIAVAHRSLKHSVEQFPDLRFNVRYCADSAECAGIATEGGPWTGPPRPRREPSPGTQQTGPVPGGDQP